jgi:hypothetical protein
MRDDIWLARATALEGFDGKGLSASQVAAMSAMNEITVRRYATKFGFDFGTKHNNNAGYQAQLLRIRQCADDGKTRPEAADHLGISESYLGIIARRHCVEFVHVSTRRAEADDRIEAMASMYRSGKTLSEIGSMYGVTRERVRQIISKHANVTAKDGGQSVRAKRRKLSKQARMDMKSLEKHGCSYEQYRQLVSMGSASKKAGDNTQNTTPTGAFKSQRRNAIRRGIGWKITLWEWWSVWADSGKWDQRGRGKSGYVMCRSGDTGDYEIGNVYIASAVHNSSFQPNNPYRKDHPDHQEVIASVRQKLVGRRTSRKTKHFDLPLGVTRSHKKFQAQISYDGRNYCLGRFDTIEEATAAYEAKRAEVDAGYGVAA